MSTKGNDPAIHFVVVEHIEEDGESVVDSVRFECRGDQTSPCHQYPDCECEAWSDDLLGDPPAEGHEDVPHDECWMIPWLDNIELWDVAESCQTEGIESRDDLRSGPFVGCWEGDYLDWEYALESLDESDETLSLEPHPRTAEGWELVGHLRGQPDCPVYARRRLP